MENIFAQRVDALRAQMRERGWDAVILTGSDPHASEYPAKRWKQVEWLSGFTGEAGDLCITLDHAGLWTDTRYFIQAVKQLAGTGIELHKMRVPEQVPIPQWLASRGFGKPVIAVDGLCQTVSAMENLRKAFDVPVTIVPVPDLLSSLWKDRPAVPSTPIITLGEDLTGESREAKIHWLRKWMIIQGVDAIFLTALDEIAWLLNVRGSDVEYNPVVISYLLVTMEQVYWFVRKDAFSEPDEETRASLDELSADEVTICDYDEAVLALATYVHNDVDRIYVDPSTLNLQIRESLQEGSYGVVEGLSPIPLRKSVKNPVEIEGMREAHLEDGLAVEKFLYWLEGQAGQVDEWQAACKLQSLRAGIPGYRGDSFETISAYGPGAALPHYVTPHVGAPILEPRGLYLVDSGGQYLFGTTDITRTVPMGPCTALEKEDYTLVMKCHIDLSMAVFPKGTAGCQLDILARNALWQTKRNFGHGTGHGVGFFLNVHEGPQEFRQNFNAYPFIPGIINTIEPGLYREGMHGVRHENVVLVREDGTNDFGTWYAFETLTLCHYDTSVLVRDLMTPDEIAWLNAYNEHVYRVLSPRLPSEIAAWLRQKTLPM
ncbi:MAG: aminopeptidase P family protein [Bacteroidales bacterium]|jgi:Xaa-Pro aminopeptidase|nr:aminopeptidase P family protein [Bacteroidales bacterium]